MAKKNPHRMQSRCLIPFKRRYPALFQALKIAAAYFVIGCFWILLSDRIVGDLIRNKDLILTVSIVKGWFYVAVTSLLFLVLIYRELQKTTLAKEKAEELNVHLEKSNALYSAILESSPKIIVFSLDTQFRYTSFNKRHQEAMLQLWNSRIAIGMNMPDAITEEKDRLQAVQNFNRVLAGESTVIMEEYGDENLSRLYWHLYYSPTRLGDGSIVGVTCFALDTTDLKYALEENEYLSYHDRLTGLFNRKYAENAISGIDQAKNYPISIVLGDVNGLKLVNDAFGSAVGDELLKAAAGVIETACRHQDILARWDGDAFIVLLPCTGSREVQNFILSVKAQISKTAVHSVGLDISFGWGTTISQKETLGQVFRKAEDSIGRQKAFESKSMRSHTIKTIIQTLHEKTPREAEHSKRVGEICYRIGLNMGYSEEQAKSISLAGFLHDIGKIAIEESVLNKPGKLTEEEFASVRRHPEIGYRILQSSDEYTEIADAILSHHEKWDGSGYPKGLKGTQIPLYARIIALADSYDAMTAQRPYKKSITAEQAADEIRRCSGTQFDPNLAKLFLKKVLGAGKPL